jgi:hypothetical protein
MPKETKIFKPAERDLTYYRQELYKVLEMTNDIHKVIDHASELLSSQASNLRNYQRLLKGENHD